MNERLAKVEVHVEHIRADGVQIKAELDGIRAEMREMDARLERKLANLGARLSRTIEERGARLSGRIDDVRRNGSLDNRPPSV